jgi:hypothetical protein
MGFALCATANYTQTGEWLPHAHAGLGSFAACDQPDVFQEQLFGEPRPSGEAVSAILAVQGWTRARFKLAPDAAVLVAEVPCRLPLCPPAMTAVAFWTEDGARHQFRLYKPVSEIVYDDIGWLMFVPGANLGTAFDCC